MLRGDEDESGFKAVVTEQGAAASRVTAATILHTISRLPGMACEAIDAVSACSLQTAKASAHGMPYGMDTLSMIQQIISKDNYMATHVQAHYGNANWNKSSFKKIVKRSKVGMSCVYLKTKLFLSVYVDDIKMVGYRFYYLPCGQGCERKLPHQQSIMYTWAAPKEQQPSTMNLSKQRRTLFK